MSDVLMVLNKVLLNNSEVDRIFLFFLVHSTTKVLVLNTMLEKLLFFVLYSGNARDWLGVHRSFWTRFVYIS